MSPDLQRKEEHAIFHGQERTFLSENPEMKGVA